MSRALSHRKMVRSVFSKTDPTNVRRAGRAAGSRTLHLVQADVATGRRPSRDIAILPRGVEQREILTHRVMVRQRHDDRQSHRASHQRQRPGMLDQVLEVDEVNLQLLQDFGEVVLALEVRDIARIRRRRKAVARFGTCLDVLAHDAESVSRRRSG